MMIGEIITTKSGVDLIVDKVRKHILLCRVVNYIDNSTATIKKTDFRIVRKDRVNFVQKAMFG